jgi:four helix bundle protein
LACYGKGDRRPKIGDGAPQAEDERLEIEDRRNMSMKFEDLETWQKARALVNGVYTLTRSGALAGDRGVSGQIQRASVSIMSNVAEGFERVHIAEKLQAYNVARGSTAEVRSLLYVIEDNFPGSANSAVQLRSEAVTVGKLVTGLSQSTESRKTKTRNFLVSFFHFLIPF